MHVFSYASVNDIWGRQLLHQRLISPPCFIFFSPDRRPVRSPTIRDDGVDAIRAFKLCTFSRMHLYIMIV